MAENMKRGMLAQAAEDEPMPAGAEMGAEGDDDVDADLDNPQFKKAVQMAQRSLYEKGAAEKLAQTLLEAPSIAEGLADASYNMLQMVDDMTDGSVPDELFMMLGITLMGEVCDIAAAAGKPPQPRDIAQAMQQLMLHVVEDSGGDTSQLREVMASIPADTIDKMAQGGDAPAQEPTQEV